jgi:hypothetical protein
MSDAIRDYIVLPRKQWKDKYPKEERRFTRNIHDLKFNLSHVPTNMPAEVEELLRDKLFSDEYIKEFMDNTKDPNEKQKDHALSSLSIYFMYDGKKLKISDIKEGLKLNKLTQIKGHSKKEILNVIEQVIRMHPDLSASLSVLERKVNSDAKDTLHTTTDIEDVIGIPDLRLVKSRKKMYEYYKKRHGLYNKMKKKIKEILKDWDAIQEVDGKLKLGEDEKTSSKRGQQVVREKQRIREDLDEDLEKLHKVYEKMDDKLNYIVKVNALKIPQLPDNDEGSSLVASNIVWSYLNSVMGGKEIHVESKSGHQDDDEDDGEDTWRKKIIAGYDNDKGEEGQPKGEIDIQQATEEDNIARDWGDEINALSVIDYADPLYALAAKGKNIKHAANLNSSTRIISTVKLLVSHLEGQDSSVKRTFDELLDEMEEIKEQVGEVGSENKYYIPFVPATHKLLSDHNYDFNYEAIETHHEEIIETINDLIEAPDGKTLLPYHWTPDDFAEDLSGIGGEREKTQKNIFAATVTGRHGKLKDLGKFTDNIVSLIKLAEEYYLDPLIDNMLDPFESLPKFLNRRDLSAITSHGRKDVAYLIQAAYIDEHLAYITPHELEEINAYRIHMNMPPSERNFKKTLEAMEEVLEILKDKFPKNNDKDRIYFANILNNIAKHNDNIRLSDWKLDGRTVSDLVSQEDVKGNYTKLINTIYALASEFKKDPNKKEQMEEFKNLHGSFDDRIKLASTQVKLLTAYDAIRKMMSKPTYYAVCELDSFDNVNDTIDIIKQEHNVELSVNDIYSMVEEVDSLESLAKKHGTNEDVVYHVKALFR